MIKKLYNKKKNIKIILNTNYLILKTPFKKTKQKLKLINNKNQRFKYLTNVQFNLPNSDLTVLAYKKLNNQDLIELTKLNILHKNIIGLKLKSDKQIIDNKKLKKYNNDPIYYFQTLIKNVLNLKIKLNIISQKLNKN